MDFFRQLFGPGDFMPHGYCYLWNPALVWLNVISDSLIAVSYFTIPFTLLWFVRKRRDIPFGFVFILFGTFIVACGVGAPRHRSQSGRHRDHQPLGKSHRQQY
jgi:hypothetical protein